MVAARKKSSGRNWCISHLLGHFLDCKHNLFCFCCTVSAQFLWNIRNSFWHRSEAIQCSLIWEEYARNETLTRLCLNWCSFWLFYMSITDLSRVINAAEKIWGIGKLIWWEGRQKNFLLSLVRDWVISIWRHQDPFWLACTLAPK